MKKMLFILMFGLISFMGFSQTITEGGNWVQFNFEDGNACRAYGCFTKYCFGDRVQVIDEYGKKYRLKHGAFINPDTGVTFSDVAEFCDYLDAVYERTCATGTGSVEPLGCEDVLSCIPEDIDLFDITNFQANQTDDNYELVITFINGNGDLDQVTTDINVQDGDFDIDNEIQSLVNGMNTTVTGNGLSTPWMVNVSDDIDTVYTTSVTGDILEIIRTVDGTNVNYSLGVNQGNIEILETDTAGLFDYVKGIFNQCFPEDVDFSDTNISYNINLVGDTVGIITQYVDSNGNEITKDTIPVVGPSNLYTFQIDTIESQDTIIFKHSFYENGNLIYSANTFDTRKCFVDLSIDKSIDSLYALVGDTVTITLQVSHVSGDPATGVYVTDDINNYVFDGCFEYVSDSPSSGSYNYLTGIWSIGDMAVSATETLGIEAIYNCNETANNVAGVYLNENDTDISNNFSQDTVASYCLSCELLIENGFLKPNGISVGANTSDILTTSPAHNGDFIISAIDINSNVIVEFGSGSLFDVFAGHIPVSENTYYMLPGEYMIEVTTADGCVFRCAEFTIEEWSVCDREVLLGYEGPTNGDPFIYQLPVNSAMSSIELFFAPQNISDQVEIFYQGLSIHNSGQVMSPPLYNVTVPLSYGVDDYLTIKVTPDPTQSLGITTIWELGVGCCSDTYDCEDYTQRDIIGYGYSPSNGCWGNLVVAVPYATPSVVNSPLLEYGLGTGLNLECITQSASMSSNCLGSTGSATIQTYGVGCASGGLQIFNGCQNTSDESLVTVTYPSTSVVNICFGSQSNYDLAKAWFDQLTVNIDLVYTSTGGAPLTYASNLGTLVGSDVTCGSDGALLTADIFWDYSRATWDDANDCVTWDYNLSNDNEDCCATTRYGQTAINRIGFFYENFQRTDSYRLYGSRSTPVGFDPDEIYTSTIQYDVIHPCGDYTQDYTIYYKPSDVTGTYRVYEGADTFGIVIQDSDDPLVGTVIGFGSFTVNDCDDPNTTRNYIGIISNGFIQECSDIDFSTNTFDLSDYGGSISESIASALDLSTRLSVLTGYNWDYLSSQCLLTNNTPCSVSNCPNIIMN